MKSTVQRSLAAVALVTAVASIAAPAAAAPAGPSDPGKLLQLSYSPAGPWADNLPTALFTMADGPLVPGEVVPKTFYVFGTPGTKADLRLTCSVEGAGLFAQRLELEYRVGGSGQFRSCEGAHDAFEVGGRKAQQVDVNMVFTSLEGQTDDMNQSASYSITVTLSQVPPKGGGKPQILGVQTLAAPEAVDGDSTVTNGESTIVDTSGNSQSRASVPSGSKGKDASAKTVNAAAALPDPNVGLTESVPLIAGLLISGALLAGFRRRRQEADQLP